MGGHKNKKAGTPFTGKTQRAGTSSLRFEELREKIDQQALRSFEVNDTLEPEVWENDKLIPEVREALLKIANDFLIDFPFKIEVEDITLTGSLANYNWSKYSDVDLHIVLDFSQVDENEELVAGFFRNLQTNWNNRHDILMKGYEVEIYFQDSRRLRAKIRNMRKTGLEGAGQYSVENLAFKVLRRSEELSRLSDLKAKAYDEFMTIQSWGEDVKKM